MGHLGNFLSSDNEAKDCQNFVPCFKGDKRLERE